MSTPQQPPPSRREARRAAHQAAAANLDGLVEPRSGSGSDGRVSSASAPASGASAPLASAPSAPAPTAPAPTAPAPSEGRFRARDFRAPSERDRGAASAPSLAPDPDGAPLTYRTAVRSPASVGPAPIEMSAPAAPSVPSPWVPVPTANSAPEPTASSGDAASPPVGSSHVDGELIDKRRMSRRELRARRASEDGTPTPAPAPAAVGREVPEEPAVAAAAAAPILEPPVVEPPILEPPVVEPPIALVEPPAMLPGESAQPQSATATGTHWSVGVHQSDDNPFENTFSRQVGSAPVSTNALVLPAMPMAAITGPVPGTGEIIITGMIDLPASVSSTGSAVHESPDIDDFFEAGEREVASSEAAPVSAINAVSGHTGTRMVMAGGKPRGNTVTIVLVASTVVMAVAAVTIFVVAAVNGLF